MPNATRWYCSRESLKRAVGISGADKDALIGSYLEAASEDIEQLLSRRFIPETATKLFRWPQRNGGSAVLYFADEDLIAVTTLQVKAQNASPTTIVAADYFLEPNNAGPPYSRIEIDLSSTAAFEAGDTPQRSISVLGRWGFREDTRAAGALAEADDGSETELDVTDASLIDVGDTILIGTEAMFVSSRATLTTGTTLNAALTADVNNVTVAVVAGTSVKQGEVILVDSEKMLVESITANNLTVKRAYDGSVLATHANATTVFAYRTLTVVRAVNGTTAATHLTAAAITKYAPPADVVLYCLAKAILALKQGESGWTGQIGGSEGAVTVQPWSVAAMRHELIEKYGKVTI